MAEGAGGERHVKFDEETIREHDKLRGTRQKIDEPDTPFHRDSLDGSSSEADEDAQDLLADSAKRVNVVVSDEAEKAGKVPVPAAQSRQQAGMLDMAAVQAKLETAAAEGSEPRAAQTAAHEDFAEKRKHHYNEMEMLRKWREEHPDGDEDGDE